MSTIYGEGYVADMLAVTESYWQRGFNDGFAKRVETPPNKNGGFDRENIGYSNGYEAGRSKRFATDWPQRKAKILALINEENPPAPEGAGGHK